MSAAGLPPLDALLRLTWWKLGLAIASGLLAALCFPPADFGPLTWVVLVPFFFALTQVHPRGGLVLGFVFGFAFMGFYASFMLIYGTFQWAAIMAFQALFFALFGLAAAACNRAPHPAVRALGVAAAWTLAEMFRGGIGGLGFTVGDLGYTQHDNLPVLQIASMVGHYGIGFLIAAVNATLTQAFLAVAPGIFVRPAMHPRLFAQLAAKTGLATYVIAILLYLWGALVIRQASEPSGETLEAAVVQAALRDSEGATRRDAEVALDTYAELSRTIPDAVDIIVWPEVAVPTPLNERPDMLERLGDLARAKSAWLVVGGYEFAPDGRVFNALYAFSPEGEQIGLYRKVILVPFGESVPMRERFPWLRRFSLRSVDFSPGEGHLVFRFGDRRVGPLICFEALFPGAVRTNARLGADLIVFATSDAWAAGTGEIAQHSATAALRAVESRRWVIRAGTWGESQIISPWGEIIARVPPAQPGSAWGEIETRSALSVYHRYGDAPLLALCAALLIAALMGLPGRPSLPWGPPVGRD